MRLLYEFDYNDYDKCIRSYERNAVRAIICKGNDIAMVKSDKEGYYKFPGGGIEKNESHIEALIRETLEETGLSIIPESIREYGFTCEKRKSTYDFDEIFIQNSYYYFAEVNDSISELSLDEYEKVLGYHLEFVPPAIAYEANKEIGKNYYSSFILREAKVLELLINENK
ncbi:MAG: NUDIX domain-containing protein [Oscillospiraceae bacterium]|nr:NUDIX domain-containing protein [Oscillospiraceae bacterium]